MSNGETYTVPGEVHTALASDRPELLKMLITRLRGGACIEREEVVGIVTVLQEYMEANQRNRLRLDAMERTIRAVKQEAEAFVRINKILRDGPPFEED